MKYFSPHLPCVPRYAKAVCVFSDIFYSQSGRLFLSHSRYAKTFDTMLTSPIRILCRVAVPAGVGRKL